jgi:signal peptidase II
VRPSTRLAGWTRLGIVLALVLAADQITKAIVEHDLVAGERRHLFLGIDLVRVLNEGVAFGFLGGSGKSGILIITGIALIAVLTWFSIDPTRRGAWIAVGLVAGGAIGNVIDRFRQDAVTDFISLPLWPTFNVADIAITFGAAALIIAALLASEEKAKEEEQAKRSQAASGAEETGPGG